MSVEPRTPAAQRAREQLRSVRGKRITEAELTQLALEVATAIQLEADAVADLHTQTQATMLARLMQDPEGQAFTTLLTDRLYRAESQGRAIDTCVYLLRAFGVPKYLPPFERAGLGVVAKLGMLAPRGLTALIKRGLRTQSRTVVLSAHPSKMHAHLQLRREEGVRVNLNHLGETVLGEREAATRMEDYLRLLTRDDVDAISIKASSICSQLDLTAFDASVSALVPLLTRVYTAAAAHPFQPLSGPARAKLVNLDMESYRDLDLTLAAFKTTLELPEHFQLTAGIVLQAYLPDAALLQRELTQWAMQRVARGGAPIRLRIVKGANLAAERVEASMRGWALPVYDTKLEVDANWARMVAYGCEPAHAAAVQLGVASHNVFSLAYGVALRAVNNVEQHVSFELLEGMANHVRIAVTAVAGDVLVYCPVVSDDDMLTAIAYLTRRLDENTADDNFLRHSFGMHAGDDAWNAQRVLFEKARALQGSVGDEPRRKQNRSLPVATSPRARTFTNEPDTDFALAANRAALSVALERWGSVEGARVGFDGTAATAGAAETDGFDPSRPRQVPYRIRLSDSEDIERAIATALQAANTWEVVAPDARAEVLRAVASAMREARMDLVALMTLDAGKRAEQGDVEVSEAIDFAEYYSRMYPTAEELDGVELPPRGVVVVTPPWNFPLAIAAGGVFAALMAGNAVLLKPPLETAWVGEKLAQLCWQGGVPRDVLQLVLCEDDVASALIRDERVSSVILTGATETARMFCAMRPELHLCAETGGKNAVIVTAMSDRDQAIKDTVLSAFGHSGQKCSAASLLICEAEVYDDPSFITRLRDAAQSLPVGSAWDTRSFVTPLIRPPSGALLRALTTLEPGETWLLEPKASLDNPRLWTPGIKLGVKPGSSTHTTELFGPVLAVMRADDVGRAIEMANGTPYGLTAGLQSLDEREQRAFMRHIHAGNLYINRGVTGAVVQRQPFGGCKASVLGPGAKAGGPNYVAQLTRAAQHAEPRLLGVPLPKAADVIAALKMRLPPANHAQLAKSACSDAYWMQRRYALASDISQVLGEQNVFSYRAVDGLVVRCIDPSRLVDAIRVCVACVAVGAKFTLSIPEALGERCPWLSKLPHVITCVESDLILIERLSPIIPRLRVLGTASSALRRGTAAQGIHLDDSSVLMTGRMELLKYLREQSVSTAYHRHGNLAARALQPAVTAT